ncbi:hypothetical protein FJY63_07535 [Candidatus Sumerlaeota bacterium]|nr:hypothetical protein [Candidatus Sumerlaeota bacterium]
MKNEDSPPRGRIQVLSVEIDPTAPDGTSATLWSACSHAAALFCTASCAVGRPAPTRASKAKRQHGCTHSTAFCRHCALAQIAA